jgi:N-acetylglucosaminyldiphosphoundecaprenol N-acetyl-beta-D-mannosaminyltransferase
LFRPHVWTKETLVSTKRKCEVWPRHFQDRAGRHDKYVTVKDALMRLQAVAGAATRRSADGDRMPLFGLPLSRTYSLENAFELTRALITSNSPRARLITFANPRAIHVAGGDAQYRADLKRMDLVFSDGIALTLAARRFGRFPMQRISFDSTSLAPRIWEYAQANGLTVALVGGEPHVAETAADRIRSVYPGISITGTADGYRPQEVLVNFVRSLDPQIVVCGMGVPKQEAFLIALTDAGWNGVGFTCGAYLDHLGDRFHFYPEVINRLNLRWLYRLAREPRRIGHRYFVEYGPFWWLLSRELLGTALQRTRPQR